MGSLWVFLNESGVKRTNNRAERALRLVALWRKGSLRTASAEGNALGAAEPFVASDVSATGAIELLCVD